MRWQNDEDANRYGWVSDKYLKEVAQGAASLKSITSAKSVGGWSLDTASRYRVASTGTADPAIIGFNAKKDSSRDILQWQELIKDLDQAFEVGDAAELAGLYTASGRENAYQGTDRILKLYTRIFSTTVDRTVSYKVSSYEYQGDAQAQAVLKGQMVAAMTKSASGRKTTSVATFIIVLIKEDNGYKISSFDWKPV